MRHGQRNWAQGWKAAAALALGTLTTLGCHGTVHFDSSDHSDEFKQSVEKTFVATRVMTLRVVADSGDVTVEPAADGVDEIRVRAIKHVSGVRAAKDAEPLFGLVKTTATLEGDTLLVESKPLEHALPNGVSAYVSYAISAPRRMHLNLHAASGDITVSGITGGSDIETASGDIALHGAGGALDLRTASGDLNTEQTRPKDSLKMHSGSGDIEATGAIAASPALRVEIESASGSVNYVGDASALNVETASGDAEMELTGALPLESAHVQSASGDVTLTLPRTVSAKLSLQTASGSVSAPGPDGSSNDSDESNPRVVTLGAGVAPVSLQTASGDIEVKTK